MAVDEAVETIVPVGDGVTVSARILGSGAPLLVPMGYPCKEYEALASTYQVVLYDPRGRGRSPEVLDARILTFDHDVADVERLREALGFETIAMIGWSYLGGVAARYAMAHPTRVSRLVLVGSTGIRCDVRQLREEQAARLRVMAPRLMARLKDGGVIPPSEGRALAYAMVLTRCGRRPPWPGGRHEHFLDVFVGGLDSRRRYFNALQHLIRTMGDWDWRADAHHLVAPVLVVYGVADLLPHQLCAEWIDALPDSRGILLPGVGHFPGLEDPDRLLDAVGEFLDGRWPAGAFGRRECPPVPGIRSWGHGSPILAVPET